jgi:hypothetical protein
MVQIQWLVRTPATAFAILISVAGEDANQGCRMSIFKLSNYKMIVMLKKMQFITFPMYPGLAAIRLVNPVVRQLQYLFLLLFLSKPCNW